MFQIKFSLGGKDGLTYSACVYPDTTLENARVQREWVKTKLREGKNLNQQKAMQRAVAIAAANDTFAAVAADWLEKRKPVWSSSHYQKSNRAS